MVYNVSQTFITITRDRLTLILTKNRGKLVRFEVVLSLLGLVAGLLLTLVTADFRDRWKVTGEQWQMAFSIALIASGVWLIVEVGRLLFWRLTIDKLVDKIEQESDHPLG